MITKELKRECYLERGFFLNGFFISKQGVISYETHVI